MVRKTNVRGLICAVVCAVAATTGPSAVAGTITFNAASAHRAASVEFSHSGTTLTATLTNTSTFDADVPVDMLTAVFFDVAGSPTLTPVSAHLGAGATVINNSVGFTGTDVGGEWAYKDGLSGAPLSAAYGISSTGLGLFGPGDLFGGTNWDGPVAPDGLQFGITSASDDGSDNNGGASVPLINHSVVFTFAVDSSFDVNKIGNVSFQYGTDLSEPLLVVVPVPPAAGLGLAGLVFIVARRKELTLT